MSLKSRHHILADPKAQQDVLENSQAADPHLTPFQYKLEQNGLFPLRPVTIETLQVNIGKLCNQSCKHCHVDAGPDRREIMEKETMQACLDVLKKYTSIKYVDITGGAPELNPHFRWFVAEIKQLHRHVMVRCNLTIILANKKYNDLPGFYKEFEVEVISSLPFYTRDRTDRQRGEGVFEDSIRALQMLNAVGYGRPDSGLVLNLVYNPAGAFLPASQDALEKEFKASLLDLYGIQFNHLYTITNMPISRYLDYLLQSGNYSNYMQKLTDAFNPSAAENVMCRNTISVGWDGFLYDCDFNQMLDLKIRCGSLHITNFDLLDLQQREIVIGQHCYGCTAGSGSSCGGVVVS